MIKIDEGKIEIEGQYNEVLAEFSLLVYQLLNNAGVSEEELKSSVKRGINKVKEKKEV